MNTQSSSIAHSTTGQAPRTVPGCVVPFGYACDSSMTKLIRLMQEDKKACIVDIRLAPRSQWHPGFNKVALAKRFPGRYVHIPELGNLHYRLQDRMKGIKLANPERGMERLMTGLKQGRTLILLCSCKDKGCHRWTVVKRLSEALPDMPNEHLVRIG